MKAPKYCAETMQQQIDVGLNAFAIQLLAESFADFPERFNGENLMLIGHAHNGTPVYMVVTTTAPTADDFDPEPAA